MSPRTASAVTTYRQLFWLTRPRRVGRLGRYENSEADLARPPISAPISLLAPPRSTSAGPSVQIAAYRRRLFPASALTIITPLILALIF